MTIYSCEDYCTVFVTVAAASRRRHRMGQVAMATVSQLVCVCARTHASWEWRPLLCETCVK